MKEYTYDIAISLCKQDIEFARKLVKALNPSLKVFFYEERQEVLISKSGPEAFAKIFKDESRVIVILSRNEWSESYYTGIERDGIIDRTSVKNEGYSSIMIIPMEQNEIPSWYPSTRIYVDSKRFTIDEIAKFVEFKVNEKGGIIKPITVEVRYHNLLDRIEEKKQIIQLQNSEEAIKVARNEIVLLKDCFNQKMKHLNLSSLDSCTYKVFTEFDDKSYFGIGKHMLVCKIIMTDEQRYRIFTTQDFEISLELLKDDNHGVITIEKTKLVFYYHNLIKGWALPIAQKDSVSNEQLVLFRNRDNFPLYDLKNPINTHELIDLWFQKLFTLATKPIEQYL